MWKQDFNKLLALIDNIQYIQFSKDIVLLQLSNFKINFSSSSSSQELFSPQAVQWVQAKQVPALRNRRQQKWPGSRCQNLSCHERASRQTASQPKRNKIESRQEDSPSMASEPKSEEKRLSHTNDPEQSGKVKQVKRGSLQGQVSMECRSLSVVSRVFLEETGLCWQVRVQTMSEGCVGYV